MDTKTIEETLMAGDRPPTLPGIASFSLDETISKHDFLKQADTALYRAKKNGRNKCCIFRDKNN